MEDEVEVKHPGSLQKSPAFSGFFFRVLFIDICISYDTVSEITQNFSLKKFRIRILKSKNMHSFDNTLFFYMAV